MKVNTKEANRKWVPQLTMCENLTPSPASWYDNHLKLV